MPRATDTGIQDGTLIHILIRVMSGGHQLQIENIKNNNPNLEITLNGFIRLKKGFIICTYLYYHNYDNFSDLQDGSRRSGRDESWWEYTGRNVCRRKKCYFRTSKKI